MRGHQAHRLTGVVLLALLLVYAVTAGVQVLGAGPSFPVVWSVGAVVALVACLVAIGVRLAGGRDPAGPTRALLLWWVVVLVGTTVLLPPDASANWLFTLAYAMTGACPVAFRGRATWPAGAVLVALYALARTAPPYAGSRAFLVEDVVFHVAVLVTSAAVVAAAHGASARLEAALARARTAMRRAGDARREEAEHTRWAAFVHDHVLTVLAAIASGARVPDAARTALAHLDRTSPPGPRPPDDVAQRLRAAVRDAAPDAVVDVTTGPDDVPLPAEVVDALVDATAEAVRNAARHAVRDGVPARVRVTADLGGARPVDRLLRRRTTTVQVADDGPGFDPSSVRGDRLGLRTSVAGRMSAVGGRGTWTSAPGAGTSVVLRWRGRPGGGRPEEPPGPVRRALSPQLLVAAAAVWIAVHGYLAVGFPQDTGRPGLSLVAYLVVVAATAAAARQALHPGPSSRAVSALLLLVPGLAALAVTPFVHPEHAFGYVTWWPGTVGPLLVLLVVRLGLRAALASSAAALVVLWTTMLVDSGPGAVPALVAMSSTPVAWPLLAAGLRWTIRRSDRAVRSLEDLAAEAEGVSHEAVRRTRAADERRERLRAALTPVLGRAAAGDLDAGLRQEAARLGAALRDDLRAVGLLDVAAQDAIAGARARGTQVVVTDDRPAGHLDPAEPALLRVVVAAASAASGGELTIRRPDDPRTGLTVVYVGPAPRLAAVARQLRAAVPSETDDDLVVDLSVDEDSVFWSAGTAYPARER